MKRFAALLLVLVLAAGMVVSVHAEEMTIARPAFEGYLIELSGQRVEDTFAYLDEFYIQKHPEAALMVYTADAEDRAAMQILSDLITQDCTTDREKAEAVHDWLARNITYEVNASAYPNDTFYTRQGNCLSYALLMQTLLRMAGVPAVVGDGWRGDMEICTADLFKMEGHAWCFAYVDEQWVLYDPLWLEDGTTDREYMEKWIWMDKTEFVVPASDSANLPPVAWDFNNAYYTDGVFYLYSDEFPQGVAASFSFINNMLIAFLSNQCEEGGSQDGWYYLDGVTDKTQMFQGQIYTNGWLSYGDYRLQEELCLAYAFPNGMMVDGAVMEFDGQAYMMSGNNCMRIVADPADYSITNGLLTFRSGYTGPFLTPAWGEVAMENYVVEVENRNPEVAVADAEGIVTCLSEGYAEIWYKLKSAEEGTYSSTKILQIYVSDEVRVADYTDRIPEEEPEETLPGVSGDGVIILPTEPEEDVTQPTQPEEDVTQPTEPEEEPEIPSISFADVEAGAYYEEPVSWAVARGITNGTSPTEFSPMADCNRAQVVTFLWRAAGEPKPVSSVIPFTDVAPGAYYTDAVLWAVEQGITQGMGDGTFGTERTCTRAQVATFLWRAAGEPAAQSQSHSFGDIQKDYYYDAVLWAVEQGITNGTSTTTFAPGNTCSRAQIVTFLFRYMN